MLHRVASYDRIVGASLEVIKAKRNQKPEVRAAAREAALAEVAESDGFVRYRVRQPSGDVMASARARSASTSSAAV